MIYKYCTCHLLFAELRRERDGFCCIEADSVGTWRFCKEPWSFWPFCQCVKWMRFFSTNDGPMDIWWSEVYGAAVAMPQIARSFWNSGVKFFWILLEKMLDWIRAGKERLQNFWPVHEFGILMNQCGCWFVFLAGLSFLLVSRKDQALPWDRGITSLVPLGCGWPGSLIAVVIRVYFFTLPGTSACHVIRKVFGTPDALALFSMPRLNFLMQGFLLSMIGEVLCVGIPDVGKLKKSKVLVPGA